MAMVGSNMQVNHVAPQQAVIVKGMRAELYSAALSGSFDEISCVSNWKEQVTPTGNNVLHIHVGKEKAVNIKFIRKVLDNMGGTGIAGNELLWKENNTGDTPLHLATTFGHVDVVKEFLERVKRDNPQDVLRMLRMSNKKKDTPLHEAARAGHANVVRFLVEADDPNFPFERNEIYETPLYLAAESGCCASVAIILNACGVSAEVLHQKGPCGRTPLHAAVQWCNSEMVRKMLEHGGNQLSIQDDEGWTPIHCAAAGSRNSHLLKELLDYAKHNRTNESSAIYIQDKEGRTALHIAILQANWNSIENIVTYCPDCVEITDNRGQTVVHYAAKSACAKMLIDFLELGHFDSLLNKKDVDGNTPLHILAASILIDPSHGCLYSLRKFIDRYPFMNIKAFNKKNLTFADMIVPNDRFLIEELKMSRKAPRGKRIYTFKKDVDVEKAISDCAEIGAAKVNSLKKVGEVGVVVAALIATISFTSALALPGGFNQDPSTDIGMAVLSGNAFFVAFLVTDIIAFIFSIVPIILYFILTMGNSSKSSMSLFNIAHVCMVISIGALAIALTTGVTAVVTNSAALLIVWFLSVVFFIFYVPVFYATVLTRLRITTNHILLYYKLSYYKGYIK